MAGKKRILLKAAEYGVRSLNKSIKKQKEKENIKRASRATGKPTESERLSGKLVEATSLNPVKIMNTAKRRREQAIHEERMEDERKAQARIRKKAKAKKKKTDSEKFYPKKKKDK